MVAHSDGDKIPPPSFYEALQSRLDKAQRRAAFIQTFWDNDDKFDLVVSTDRYLKLCTITERATTSLEALCVRV